MALRLDGQRMVAELLAAGASVLGTLSVAGTLTMAAGAHLDASAAGSRILFDGAAGVAAPPVAPGNDLDCGLYRGGVNDLRIGAGGALSVQFLGVAASVNGTLSVGTYLYLPETSNPTAVANYAILYSKDVAAKTQLSVLFPTGVVQQIKIEA